MAFIDDPTTGVPLQTLTPDGAGGIAEEKRAKVLNRLAKLLRVMPEQFGAVGNKINDDTAAVQAAVDAAGPIHGKVWLSAAYRITASIVVTAAISVAGNGCQGLYGSIATQGYAEAVDYPTVSPYLVGSLLFVDAAGIDGIKISVQGAGVTLEDFGVLFSDTYAFNNTGHGINCVPLPNLPSSGSDPNTGIAFGGKPDWGIATAYLSKIWVWGHDGNHYGFRAVNLTLCSVDHLTTVGGPCIELYSNTNFISPGNSTITQCYGAWFVGGSGHGIYVHHDGPQDAGCILNLWLRPQVNQMKVPADSTLRTTFSITDIDPSTQKIAKMDPHCYFTTIIAPDFEGGLDVPGSVDLPVNTSQFVMLPGIAKGMGDYVSGVYLGQHLRVTSDGLRILMNSLGQSKISLLNDGTDSYLDFQGTLNLRRNDGTPIGKITANGHITGAPEIRAKLSSTVTLFQANDAFQYVTGLTVDLLAPGRYLLLANLRVGTASGASIYSFLKLQNATLGAEILGNRRLAFLLTDGNSQITVSPSWVVTTTDPCTIQIHATANNGQVQYLADDAGVSELIAVPI